MLERNSWLDQIKTESLGVVNQDTGSEESFQNATLRPILKLQKELFIETFKNYAIKQKYTFFDLAPDKKEKYIENAIQKDLKLRNVMKGMIIALFTIDEYKNYIKNSSNLNKRMMNLLIERLKSQVMLIDNS
ncbi:glyoxalase [Flavobacterium sp.]|uniref:glyoxalase n=1 Tax=Flavobacterium sp. TaxID=239 RepID=UPI0025BD04CE|nr:glyoxalase [Flavobacterium sp.]